MLLRGAPLSGGWEPPLWLLKRRRELLVFTLAVVGQWLLCPPLAGSESGLVQLRHRI